MIFIPILLKKMQRNWWRFKKNLEMVSFNYAAAKSLADTVTVKTGSEGTVPVQ